MIFDSFELKRDYYKEQIFNGIPKSPEIHYERDMGVSKKISYIIFMYRQL